MKYLKRYSHKKRLKLKKMVVLFFEDLRYLCLDLTEFFLSWYIIFQWTLICTLFSQLLWELCNCINIYLTSFHGSVFASSEVTLWSGMYIHFILLGLCICIIVLWHSLKLGIRHIFGFAACLQKWNRFWNSMDALPPDFALHLMTYPYD